MDKNVYGILAIFVGGLGIHKFYAGRHGLGILYLIFCWTFIPALIAFVEGIIALVERPTSQTTTSHPVGGNLESCKNHGCYVALLVVLFPIFIIGVIMGVGEGSSPAPQSSPPRQITHDTTPKTPRQITHDTTPKTQKWNYFSRTTEMGDKVIGYFLESSNSLKGEFPYHNPFSGQIFIRRHSLYGDSIYLAIDDDGPSLTKSFEGNDELRVSVDDGNPFLVKYTLSRSGRVLFFGEPGKLYPILSNATSIKVEVPFFELAGVYSNVLIFKPASKLSLKAAF